MRFLPLMFAFVLFLGCNTKPPVDSNADDSEPPTPVSTADEEPETSEPETGESESFVIDVRSKREWDTGHIEQAAHIPHTEIAERIGEVTTRKDAKIILYCAVGGRAGNAKTKLEELGYTNVENGGGYNDVKERFK